MTLPHVRLLPILLLAPITVGQKAAPQPQLEKLVFALVEPNGRLLTQERILSHGKAAVPLLVDAVLKRDFRYGSHSWTDVPVSPGLAGLTWDEVRDGATTAALQVLRTLGRDATHAARPLADLYAQNASIASPYRRIASVLNDTVVILAAHAGRPPRSPLFFNHPLHRLAPDMPLADLVSSLTGSPRDTLAACILLGLRRKEIVADRKLRERLQSELLDAIATRGRRGLIHENASYLLACIGSKSAVAAPGYALMLKDIRAMTRHTAALELGRFGSRAARHTFDLIECLRDPVPYVRQAAFATLGLIGKDAVAAIPHLRLLALGKDKRLARLAGVALRSVDPEPKELWTYYHRKGNKQAEGRCNGTTKVGRWTFWRANGSKHWEGEYVNGKMHGKWMTWDRFGTETTFEYDHGRLIAPSTGRRP